MLLLYQSPMLAVLVYEHLLQCRLQRPEALDARSVCRYLIDLAFSRAALVSVCRCSALAVGGSSAHFPQAWHYACFRCEGGPRDLVARTRALKGFTAVALAVQVTLLQREPWSVTALCMLEACRRWRLIHTRPNAMCVRRVDVSGLHEHSITKCELRRTLPDIARRLVCSAAASKVMDAIDAYSSSGLIPSRRNQSYRYLSYPLLSPASNHGDVFIVLDRHPEVQRCASARRGLVSVLMTKQTARVRGYDSFDHPSECQIMLRATYSSSAAAVRGFKITMITRISIPAGCLRLELTGINQYYDMLLTW